MRPLNYVVSSSIPLSAAFVKYAVITGGLGALIALFEGLQQLNQYHQNWITLLAERVESLVSQEHSKWTSASEQLTKDKQTPTR